MNLKHFTGWLFSFIAATLIFGSIGSFAAFSFKLPAKKTASHFEFPQNEILKFPKEGNWFQSAPLDKRFFKDKLTLVYVWDYTSINCIREFAVLKRWQQHYKHYGLQLLWIHAPEFSMGKNSKYVQNAVKQFDLKGPVFLDNDFKLWDALKLKSWPTKMLVDSNGKILWARAGEGNHAEMETAMRSILKSHDSNRVLPPAVVEKHIETHNPDFCGGMSAETYLGFKRATWWGAGLVNHRWVPDNEAYYFKDRGQRAERGFFAEGLWTSREDYFEHSRNTGTLYDYAGLIYQGKEVYSVLHATGPDQRLRVYVTRDDLPIPQHLRGRDIKVDEKGETYVLVDQPRLYDLIHQEDDQLHELKLWSADQNLAISSFSFSNACLAQR